VKVPFNIQRAKGTAYQTGVWDPLIIAGPLVSQPDREVNHMVNMVDVYRLFGEIARIDVDSAVPRSIDSAPMLAYLTNAAQPSVRSINFTMGGYNIQANGGRNPPCVISGSSCTQIPISKSVCEDNNGVWWGPGATDTTVINAPTGYQSCCQVNQALFQAAQPQITINPEISIAIRNADYKIVRNTVQTYDSLADSCSPVVTSEFYEVDQATPIPKLDDEQFNLLLQPLDSSLQATYDGLLAQLDSILASQPSCPGDGNIDGTVNSQDISEWTRIVASWIGSSVYDFNFDAVTNSQDQQVINTNQGSCPRSTSIY